ncbi:MAG: U32 family peptidase [Clostridiales bacterium]|nr:U32 family peptidase [Clostridiales bacterium]
MELLAPCGSQESLEAALRCGADAVYFGVGSFNARRNAENFSEETLAETVGQCHLRGVQVHLTLNTLVSDAELPRAMEVVRRACEAGVDALIVQDLGLVSAIREAAPDMPLHGSTQMSVHSPAGVKRLAELGLTRAVLARELSRDELREIAAQSPIELEVFVHGALCMSVSGQCLMSAMLGSRSGNRGLCAQPCRLPFAAPDGTAHALSLKDLSLMERLPELTQMGIKSVKIEGRMKRPEYVAAAVTACRQWMDGGRCDEELSRQLQAVFSRNGFTSGYYDGERGRGMLGVRRKEDVTGASPAVLSSLRQLYHKERPAVAVDCVMTVESGAPATLAVRDQDGNHAFAEGPAPQQAVSRPLDAERCAEQLKKTGGTPYFVREAEVELLDENLALPMSAVNALRRDALSQLSALRMRAKAVPFEWRQQYTEQNKSNIEGQTLEARFSSYSRIPDTLPGISRVWLPLPLDRDKLASLPAGLDVGVEVPRALFGRQEHYRRLLREAKAAGVTRALAGTLDGVQLALEEGFLVNGGWSLNLFNSQALETVQDMGLQSAIVSAELTLSQAEKLISPIPVGLFAYGRLPMMLTRNCPAANSCAQCGRKGELTDRKGIRFPVRCAGAASEVLNSVPLYLGDRMRELSRFDFLLFSFTDETPRQVQEVLSAYRSQSPAPQGMTRGLYYRGVE